MTDEVAIVTKAKENIIFAMSALSEQQRLCSKYVEGGSYRKRSITLYTNAHSMENRVTSTSE
ncbi:unnamed protein product [Cylicostephanus goldi]|uniref:Uncharacterized protein n=1 Tax=Cylicostephanus goldi TaxID=71465 RepID=A0A3P7MJW0_CYLGO|nr:unnamed protein product [Cylicostephanus goldi]